MSVANQFRQFLDGMFGSVLGQYRQADLERMLSRMDDRLLSDIGISRDQITAVTREGANDNGCRAA